MNWSVNSHDRLELSKWPADIQIPSNPLFWNKNFNIRWLLIGELQIVMLIALFFNLGGANGWVIFLVTEILKVD